MDFKQFFEMIEKLGASVDDIKITPTSDYLLSYMYDYSYEFFVDEQKYGVFFKKENFMPGSIPVYAVMFTGPNGMKLTGFYKATKIYGEVIRVIKKFVEQINPAGFEFNGTSPEQDYMYRILYNKYLSKDFVQVSTKPAPVYISKIYLNNLQKTQPATYDSLMQTAQGINNSDYEQTLRNQKNSLRMTRTQLP